MSLNGQYRPRVLLANGTLAGAINTTPGASNVWTNETSGLAVSFVAPVSGVVEVSISAYLVPNTAASQWAFGYGITGGLSRSPTTDETIGIYFASSAIAFRAGLTYPLIGLTPNVSYTLSSAVIRFSGSGLMGVTDRRIHVKAV